MSVAAPTRPGPVNALRRWGPWALLAVVVVVAASIGFHHSSSPTLDQRATSLGNRVRCPVCEGQNVNQSDTPPAAALKAQIRSGLSAGQSDSQILGGITRSYGPGILERPPAKGVNLLVWIIPILAVIVAAGGLVLAFRRWRPAAATGASASTADQALVAEALDDPGDRDG